MKEIRLIRPEQVFREMLLQHSSLLPLVEILNLKRPFGNQSLQEVCKANNQHASVLMYLFEICLSDAVPIIDALPSYGLLQGCDIAQALNENSNHLLKRCRVEGKAKQLLQSIIRQVEAHDNELNTVLIPHIHKVYELYYSPEYTPEKFDLLPYSMDFFPKNGLPVSMMQQIEEALEIQSSWEVVTFFHQITMQMTVLGRIENLFIRPLVLMMEESIVSSWHKKNQKPQRINFLTVSPAEDVHELLSRRELEVLRLVASGLLNKEIAEKLGISLTTVISHRKHIVGKLGINTLAGLTVYAYTRGYLSVS
jgi:DNA-binding NarL/FixJ family response regulator